MKTLLAALFALSAMIIAAQESGTVMDAEDGGTADFTSTSSGGSSTFAASTTQISHGSYSYRAYCDATNSAYGEKTIAFSGTDLYVRFYIYVASGTLLNTYWSQGPVLVIRDGSQAMMLFGVAATGGEPAGTIGYWWFCDDLGSGGGDYEEDAEFAFNEWHYLEMHFYKDASAGYMEYRVDGGTIVKTNGGNHNTSAWEPDAIRVGWPGEYALPQSGATVYVDDIKVSLTGWIGAYSAGGGGGSLPLIQHGRRMMQ